VFPEIGEKALLRMNKIEAQVTRSAKNLTALNKYLKVHTRELTDTHRAEILEALQGKRDLIGKGIPASTIKRIKQLIEDVRTDMDYLSSQIQAQSGRDYGLIDIIENNKGEYVTRTYEVFTNPNWAEKLFDKMPKAQRDVILAGARKVVGKRIDTIIKSKERSIKKLKKKKGRVKGDAAKTQEMENKIQSLEKEIEEYKAHKSTPENLNEFIRLELESINDEGKVRDSSKPERTGKTNNEIFKKRNEELSPEIRALWGEITDSADPYKAITHSILRVATQLQNSLFQRDVGNIINEQGLITTDVREANKKGWVKTSLSKEGFRVLRETLGISPTTDIYLPKPIALLLESTLDIKTGDQTVLEAIQGWAGILSSGIKKNMTVWNPSGQSVNVIGNLSFTMAAGKIFTSPVKYSKNLKLAVGIYVKDSFAGQEVNTENAELISLAQENNIYGSSLELETQKDFLDSDQGKKLTKKWRELKSKFKLAKGLDWVDTIAENLYEAGDGIWKLADFKTRLDEYASILGGVEDFNKLPKGKLRDQVVEMAAKETRNEFPNYNETYEFVNSIRKSKLVGAFPSFVAEAVRTRFATLQRQSQHIRGKNLPSGLTPEQITKIQKKAGVEMASNIFFSHVLGVTATTIAQSLFSNLSDEEEEVMRDELLYKWENNAVIVKKPDQDTYNVIQTGYYLPTGYIAELLTPVMRSLSGDSDKPIVEAFIDTGKSIVEPYLGPDILVGFAVAIGFNRNSFGSDISRSDDPEGVFTKFVEYMGKSVGGAPGQIVRRAKYEKAIEDAKLALEDMEVGSEEFNRTEQRLELMEKRFKAKGAVYLVGGRYNVHNISQDISYAFMNKAQKLMKKKNIYKDLTNNFETDGDSIRENFNYTESEYHGELEKVRQLFDKLESAFPDLEYEQINKRRFMFNKSAQNDRAGVKAPPPMFSKKEWEYIKGVVDIPPDLVIKDFDARKDI